MADAQALRAIAEQGRVLVFFPEGTFTRRAGLSGFYLGAFKVAAEAGIPVLPGVIRGARSILRGDQWFPRRGAVTGGIMGSPISTAGDIVALHKRYFETTQQSARNRPCRQFSIALHNVTGIARRRVNQFTMKCCLMRRAP